MDNKLSFGIRPMANGDSHYLVNIDRKVIENPWSIEEWQLLRFYFLDWQIIVSTIDEIPVGFYILEPSMEQNICRIHKLAALPEVKRYGIETSLLDHIEYSTMMSGINTIEYPVPEFSCLGENDPYDMSQWLLSKSFKCESLIKDSVEFYGYLYDIYVFKKELNFGVNFYE
jgi:hypothetical protein